jgi:hypothetical protein
MFLGAKRFPAPRRKSGRASREASSGWGAPSRRIILSGVMSNPPSKALRGQALPKISDARLDLVNQQADAIKR